MNIKQIDNFKEIIRDIKAFILEDDEMLGIKKEHFEFDGYNDTNGNFLGYHFSAISYDNELNIFIWFNHYKSKLENIEIDFYYRNDKIERFENQILSNLARKIISKHFEISNININSYDNYQNLKINII